MIVEELRAEKARQRKTYAELESMTGINGRTMQKKLTGTSKISVDQFFSLCAALNISATKLAAAIESRLSESRKEEVI